MRGRILAALVPALLLSACGGPEVPLEELRQQAENGACVLSVDADVEAGRDTWMGFMRRLRRGKMPRSPWCTGTTEIPTGTAAKTVAIRTACRLRRGFIPGRRGGGE